MVAEGAGAATTAAAMTHREALKGRKVGLMLSGGNLPNDVLAGILASG
jgi:threonine dehydratase